MWLQFLNRPFSHTSISWPFPVKFSCHNTPLITNQHWHRQWFGAGRYRAITCTVGDPIHWLCVTILHGVNSSPAAYMPHWIGAALVQVLACRLVGAKPLPGPIMAYRQSDPSGELSVKFESKYKTFNWWKCIWKCRLQNGGHFLGRWVNCMKIMIYQQKPIGSWYQTWLVYGYPYRCIVYNSTKNTNPFITAAFHVRSHFCTRSNRRRYLRMISFDRVKV